MIADVRSIVINMIVVLILPVGVSLAQSPKVPSYEILRTNFVSPDYAEYGEVPLWWWEADSLTEKRVTWQLETLAEKGVKSVNPIQRSPGRTYPASFTDEWWNMIRYTNEEAQRLGMHLWIYDQIGYGHYGWLEKASAEVEDPKTSRIEFYSEMVDEGKALRIELPEGKVLDARAYPMKDSIAVDEKSRDISGHIGNNILSWKPEQGIWKVAVSVAVPYRSFYLNEASTDTFLDQLYEKMEEVVGKDAMGNSLRGVFQDEHPPTPRNIYTEKLARDFKNKFGYNMGRAIPSLHFDVGAKTPKYRTDFFDAYISEVENTYWKKVYDWTHSRNLLTSYDNWGRKDIYDQSFGYMDYFRTQRWFSAPGMDDYLPYSLENRNYYDTKIGASISRLYDRERVWAEAFHTSGWGRTTNQTLTWLSTLFTWGANLYNEHGLYYSINANTWEHAAPDPHWRQPYWEYYQEISDWVARTSYVITRGTHVTDVAVHYPVTSVLAELAFDEDERTQDDLNYNLYMELSRHIYNDGIDNDIIDDQSILEAEVKNGRMHVAGNDYQALVFGPESTFRLSVLEKVKQLVESGGTVLFYGNLPTASAENGRIDSELSASLAEMLGVSSVEKSGNNIIGRNYQSGGYTAFVPDTPELLPSLLSSHIDRDFIAANGQVYYQHRSIGEVDAYLLQNTGNKLLNMEARFRVDGVPEIWDPFTGQIHKVSGFKRNNGYTRVNMELEGNVGKLLIFKPSDQQSGQNAETKRFQSIGPWVSNEKELSKYWNFSVKPTRDNTWGAFRWPPSDEKIGPEIRQFKYKEEAGASGITKGWHSSSFDDRGWEEVLYSKGPYWLTLQGMPENENFIEHITNNTDDISLGGSEHREGEQFQWEAISFSQKLGKPAFAGWGGHSGYPDGHIDRNFIALDEGPKLLYTRLYTPKKQRVGLKVELRNSSARLWVNGAEQSFQGAVGNLPLKKGYNSVLLHLPDGTGGRLYVQREPPVVEEQGQARGKIQPDLRNASWIWSGSSDGTYLRKSFELNETPTSASTVVTGLTGFMLYVNGQKVGEEIGPWVDWKYPERIDIKPYLREGENVIAAWGQYYSGQHYKPEYSDQYSAVALALKAVFENGNTFTLETDHSWKGSFEQSDGWETIDFDDSEWHNATVKGEVGDDPWGTGLLENIGSSTTPYRPLSISLSSPYITAFDEVPEVRYDIKPRSDKRVGWYRFEAPPGISQLQLDTGAKATVWVNGEKVPINNGIVSIEEPPLDMSIVAIRLEMEPGRYAGAAFENPIALNLEGGRIRTGSWTEFGLPTYSGIGVYQQDVQFTPEEARKNAILDLGKVAVATEVFVNGTSAGVRVAEPFKFNISDLVKPGSNNIEIRVANTLSPHLTIPKMTLHPGPTTSGLIGPVTLTLHSK
ncbi:glycosyl hydrolase [Halalkalibaculum sp. DA3122]|uniref:glycosyl hydrolase n=1 Tax=Halalkalibaculum sp. DA3122 TaxID=3373607 RepID=UPI0037542808